MSVDVLIDTNLLVYAFDPRDRRKQRRALEVLRHLVATGRGKVSTQVLGEFYAVSTTKLDPRLSPREAADQVVTLSAAWAVLAVTPLVVLEAVRGALGHRLDYWDAQLWATARLNQVPRILSEDFAHGRVLEGIEFTNPFASSFELAALD